MERSSSAVIEKAGTDEKSRGRILCLMHNYDVTNGTRSSVLYRGWLSDYKGAFASTVIMSWKAGIERSV